MSVIQTRRLHYLCRRGTRELELLLKDYLDHHYQEASIRHQNVFKWLLNLEDDCLWDWILLEGSNSTDGRSIDQLKQAIEAYIKRH